MLKKLYSKKENIVFNKTKEAFGGLSNMAAGFKIHIPLGSETITILTSEALYQACRYPHLPELQQTIIEQKSPMSAKMKSKPYRNNQSREDWDEKRVDIMRWCLQVKLIQNWESFSSLLLSTENKQIVEQSRKDNFWGAIPINDNELLGQNVLGNLLVELRENIKKETIMKKHNILPLNIPDFLLYNQPIPALIGFELL